MDTQRKKVIIIGAGPAGLMAADVLGPFCEVHVYEKGETDGRKFLVAGKGGFNLTNSARGEALISKYTPADFLKPALEKFDSAATREWLAQLGIPTYEGTSGRIFPEEGIKPIQVLQKIRAKLKQQNVQFHFGYTFVSLDEKQQAVFKKGEEEITVAADHYLFALGGASWAVTGSDGNWLSAFEKAGIRILPFRSSNCGVNVAWPAEFQKQFAGTPLKNVELRVNNFQVKGEALVSEYGLEGNAIYPLIPEVRKTFSKNEAAVLHIDFKPLNTTEQLLEKVKGKTVNTKEYKTVFNLSPVQMALLKAYTSKAVFLAPGLFVQEIKNLEIPLVSLRPVEEAISTVGGIALDEVNADFTLKKIPSVSIAGEMLDWDAPTGGFLLQGCFSSAYFAAQEILHKLQG